MDINEFITSMSRELPWGRHLFGVDIPGQNVAYRVIDFDPDTEVIKLKAVGDNRIVDHHVSDLYEIEGDVCSCGDLNCEWHDQEED